MSVGRITLDALEIVELEVDPTITGVSAPVGSIGLRDDGSGLYYKSGAGNTQWILLKNFGIDLYSNTTRFQSSIRFYTRTLTSGTNGIVTVHPTSDGTASGSALFSSILGRSCIPTFEPGNIYQAPFYNHQSTAGDLRTVTFGGYRGVSQGILIGGIVQTLERAPSGLTVNVTLVGIGV